MVSVVIQTTVSLGIMIIPNIAPISVKSFMKYDQHIAIMNLILFQTIPLIFIGMHLLKMNNQFAIFFKKKGRKYPVLFIKTFIGILTFTPVLYSGYFGVRSSFFLVGITDKKLQQIDAIMLILFN